MYLLDASALLAVLLQEPGADRVEGLKGPLGIHAINLAEAVSKLVRRGVPVAAALDAVNALGASVFKELSIEHVRSVAVLHAMPLSRSMGLSLGDTVCLAMSAALRFKAVTCDRQWSALAGVIVDGTSGAPIQVETIR